MSVLSLNLLAGNLLKKLIDLEALVRLLHTRLNSAEAVTGEGGGKRRSVKRCCSSEEALMISDLRFDFYLLEGYACHTL